MLINDGNQRFSHHFKYKYIFHSFISIRTKIIHINSTLDKVYFAEKQILISFELCAQHVSG